MTESIRHETWSAIGVALHLCISLFVFLFVFLAPPVYASGPFSITPPPPDHDSGPMCKKLPPANWSRDYIRGFLSEVYWDAPNRKPKPGGGDGFYRFYPPDTVKLHGKVINDDFIVVYPIIHKGGIISEFYAPYVQSVIKTYASYTGLNLTYKNLTHNINRQYSDNIVLLFSYDFQYFMQTPFVQNLYKKYSFDKVYNSYIKGKSHITSVDTGSGFRQKPYYIWSIQGVDLQDFNSVKAAFRINLQGSLLGIAEFIHKDRYRSLLTLNYDVDKNGNPQLMPLDKYLLCATYSKRVPLGTKEKRNTEDIINEIMRLQRKNTTFWDKVWLKAQQLFTGFTIQGEKKNG